MSPGWISGERHIRSKYIAGFLESYIPTLCLRSREGMIRVAQSWRLRHRHRLRLRLVGG
ncbi:hypothetical protein M404DRAFT_325513 [Pisolithus tinctorius Marx 270]|uniref:Uncharacterized protein n=1 Tax=Pisolithus tinctorius Marx 270 TaxID=870435 RepID=A0A0C3PKL0_PISTI|nr:hypothetical protein M404DRAFT_325513 [Pisolithus tinctorius Marx 270]